MNSTVSNSAAMASPDLWITLLKSAAMLCIVLALLLGILFLMRRLFYRNARMSGRGLIRTVASNYVAPKERIVLIEVLGEMLLLGITPYAINCLAKIPVDGRLEIQGPSNPEGPEGFFSNFLKTALSGRARRNETDNPK